MTENKRFTITQDFEEHHRQIRDNGHIIMGCFVEPQAEVIVDLLNSLADENEQLKSKVDYLEGKIQRERASAMKQHEKWENEIQKENEQLKDKYNEQSVQYEGLEEQVERLLDFKDNVFNLIDELIKKAEKDVEDLRKDAYEKGYAYNPYYYWGVAHGLKKLKEELIG